MQTHVLADEYVLERGVLVAAQRGECFGEHNGREQSSARTASGSGGAVHGKPLSLSCWLQAGRLGYAFDHSARAFRIDDAGVIFLSRPARRAAGGLLADRGYLGIRLVEAVGKVSPLPADFPGWYYRRCSAVCRALLISSWCFRHPRLNVRRPGGALTDCRLQAMIRIVAVYCREIIAWRVPMTRADCLVATSISWRASERQYW